MGISLPELRHAAVGVTHHGCSRRNFLVAASCSAGSMLMAWRAGAVEIPPKEAGLSSEGLLAGQPGFQPRTVAPLPHQEIPGFLSRVQLATNYSTYVKAVESLKFAEQSLATADRAPAKAGEYAALRRQQVAAGNAVLLHELYFRNLALSQTARSSYIVHHLREHMGSPERWANDFLACGGVAKSWVALVYDPYDDRWHNTVMDNDLDGGWVGANPLVVCDVAEHAYAEDYQRREDYLTRFLTHIDWNEVARRYRRVDRM